MLFQKVPVAITVASEQSSIDTVSLFVTLADIAGIHMLQNITSARFFFCVFEVIMSSHAFLTRSFCGTPKLKVNSTYWPHLERPFTCAESHPVWTRWQTEILIIPLLLSSEEVEAFFVFF